MTTIRLIFFLAVLNAFWGCTESETPYEVVIKTYSNSKPEVVETYIGKGDDMKKLRHVEFYPNGKMRIDQQFKDGKEHGRSAQWYENGQMKFLEFYKSGEKDSVAVYWFEDGTKGSEEYYVRGKIDGKSVTWFKSGQVSTE